MTAVNEIIKLIGLSCTSGSNYLLNNISWTIDHGDQWVVFGRNGCGKTTLLSIIAGYKSFTSGQLEIFGTNYTDNNILQIRKRFGWISSSFFDNYYSNESVLAIVLSGLYGTLGIGYQLPTNKEIIRAMDLLDHLGIKKKHKLPFNMLSKGERQNVLIARAFITSPEILILDEPGTGLDVLARENLLHLIRELSNNKKMTTIYVTHYPEEILPSFNKCLLLHNGTIYKVGPTEELMNSNVMSAFLNTPVSVLKTGDRYLFSINRSENEGREQNEQDFWF